MLKNQLRPYTIYFICKVKGKEPIIYADPIYAYSAEDALYCFNIKLNRYLDEGIYESFSFVDMICGIIPKYPLGFQEQQAMKENEILEKFSIKPN